MSRILLYKCKICQWIKLFNNTQIRTQIALEKEPIVKQSQKEQQTLIEETLKKYINEKNFSSNDRGNTEVYRTRNVKRKRSSINQRQTYILNELFKLTKYVDSDQVNRISSVLGLDAEVISVWFQNLRIRKKKQNSNSSEAEKHIIVSATQ